MIKYFKIQNSFSGFTRLETKNHPGKEKFLTGFTVIEFIVIALIVAILAVVVSVDISRSNASAKLEGARWRLKSDLSYAQSLAVTQQVNHGIIFSPSTETYSVYRQTTSNIVTNPLTGSTFSVDFNTDKLLNGVDIVSTSFGSPVTTDRVEFDSFGISYSDGGLTPLSTDGSVGLSLSGISVSVIISKNTGKIK